MPSFVYQSLSRSGEPHSGTIAAADRAAAVRLITARGETPTRIETEGGGGAARAVAAPASTAGASVAVPRQSLSQTFSFLRREKPTMKRAEMANLIRELATALEAGLPLMSALRTVRRQASSHAMEVILDHLIQRVEAGTPLHAAAREYGPPFDDMIIGMLRAADASGEMSEIMHQLADLLERSIELRRSVIGATIYPAIVFTLIVASFIVLITVLVPNLIEPMREQIQMPLPTQVLLWLANVLQSWGILVLVALILLYVGFRAWLRVEENRLRFDGWLLRAPLLGKLLRDVAVARFTRTLGTLSSAGLPILEGLRITRDTLGNRALMSAIDEVQHQVTTGRPLAEPLEKSGLFPPLLVQIVNLGERSGKLEVMLLHAAKAFDRQVQNSIKIFTALLPPVLLVAMAALGGFVLAAILLPLLEMQNMIS